MYMLEITGYLIAQSYTYISVGKALSKKDKVELIMLGE